MSKLIKVLKTLTLLSALSLTAQVSFADTKLQNVPHYAFNKIVAFGDSLSDSGNFYNATLYAHRFLNPNIPVLPAYPYWNGRFSNGRTWVEDLAEDLNLPLQDNAWGGAKINSTSDDQSQLMLLPPNLATQFQLDDLWNQRSQPSQQQIDQDQKTLWVLWMGGNDYLPGKPDGMSEQDFVNQTVNVLKQDLDNAIINDHMKYLLLLKLPDLGKTPYAMSDSDFSAQLTTLSNLHNKALENLVDQEKNAHPDLHIMLFEADKFMQDMIANPSDYGYSSVNTPCLGSTSLSATQNKQLSSVKQLSLSGLPKLPAESRLDLNRPELLETIAHHKEKLAAMNDDIPFCANPDQYLFWDSIHPTKVTHKRIAAHIEEFLAEQMDA